MKLVCHLVVSECCFCLRIVKTYPVPLIHCSYRCRPLACCFNDLPSLSQRTILALSPSTIILFSSYLVRRAIFPCQVHTKTIIYFPRRTGSRESNSYSSARYSQDARGSRKTSQQTKHGRQLALRLHTSLVYKVFP